MPSAFERSTDLFRRAKNSIAGGINSGIRELEAPVRAARIYDQFATLSVTR